ncbi:MAG: DUF4249 domain-containing protein [Bacteroidales bacterium]|nr:DUF4249 domain-containing protein [Bacteroidales bacterium]
MKKLKYIIVSLTVFIFISCEKTLDMDIPDGEHKIVINSLFSDADSSILVHVSKSLHVLDKSDQLNLPGAKVKLYENNSFVASLDSIGDGLFSLESIVMEHGRKYEIEVSCQGLTTARASNTIPQKIAIESIDTLSVTRYQSNLIECRMKINDPGSVKNFYIVRAMSFSFDEYDEYEYPASLISDDPVVEEYLEWGDNGFVFSDELINGKNYELIFYMDKWAVSSWSGNPVFITFILESVSEEYYKYAISYSRHQASRNNPFAEPVQVFCNVENGFGIFAGYSADFKIIPFLGYTDDGIYME